MGRPPKGLDHVNGLCGDRLSKQRLRVVLETVSGERTVESACRELGIGEARFHVLRREALEGALHALEPSPRGRPGKPAESAEAVRIRELEATIQDLRIDLELSRVRTEIALTMPQVLIEPAPSPTKKKRKPSAKRRRKQEQRARKEAAAQGATVGRRGRRDYAGGTSAGSDD